MNYSDLLLIGDHNRLEKLEEDQEFIYQVFLIIDLEKLSSEQCEVGIRRDRIIS